MSENVFTHNDMLMLEAVSGKVDVESWICLVDYRDKSIISYEEMSESLEKLQRSGFIAYEDGKFRLSPLAKKLCKSKSLREQSYTEVCEAKYKISRGEYDSALRRYLGK